MFQLLGTVWKEILFGVKLESLYLDLMKLNSKNPDLKRNEIYFLSLEITIVTVILLGCQLSNKKQQFTKLCRINMIWLLA